MLLNLKWGYSQEPSTVCKFNNTVLLANRTLLHAHKCLYRINGVLKPVPRNCAFALWAKPLGRLLLQSRWSDPRMQMVLEARILFGLRDDHAIRRDNNSCSR